MFWLFRRKKTAVPPTGLSIDRPDLENICHEIHNAIQGLKLERRRLLSAVSTYIANCDNHIERIERALNRRKAGI